MRLTPRQLWWGYLQLNSAAQVATVPGFFGLACGMIFVFVVNREIEYATEGVRTGGKVIRTFHTARPTAWAGATLIGHGGGHKRSYKVVYEFRDANGVLYFNEGSIDKERWDALKPGDLLEVEYLPSDPLNNRPVQTTWETLSGILVLTAFGPGLLLLAWFLLRHGIRESWARVRLISDGRPVVGLVDVVFKRRVGKGRTCVTLKYRFLVGEVLRSAETEELPRERWEAWKAGDAVLVLIDPEDTERFAADVFDARRDDLDALLGPGVTSTWPSAAPNPPSPPPADGC